MSRKIRSSEASEPVEAKAKRIAIGATAAGVLLIVVLVVFLIIQFAMIGVRRAEKRRLQNTIEQYEKLNKDEESNLDFYKTEEGLRMLAVLQGWTKGSSGK